ncbi:MAG TPA: BTAD domain-containing putative transcriptional regulator [Gaiellaceae bacterium]
MGLEVRLLGSVEALADGRALSIGGPKQRALLALLALEPGRPVTAAQLCEELWHGAPPARADATLRSYISRLRRTLGCDRVEAKAGGYALHADSLDAHRFERLLQQGRDELARGAAGLAAERLHAALALWRGRALADVGAGGVLAAEARRLDELRVACLEERIEADLALARHEALVAELRALVEDEPLRERFWRQLAVALYRSGRQAEALAAYGEARHLLDTELGLEPSAELRELERAILRQEVETVRPAQARHNLPAPVTSFVGRDRELAEVESLLREHRLVTLTGMGGAGKTRLALEAAWRQLDAWSGGVWLVDLTALSDPRLVVPTVAAAIGVLDDSQHDVAEALLAHARPLELLLLLDNCEHLVEACADVARALLRGCPTVRILATSRVPLKLPAERDYALDPLEPPLAVRLFLERAAAVRRDLPSGDDVLETATAICDDLDGLPLAIELAAARAKALSLSEIAARLDDRFRFLRAWQRVADHRHRTLETTMDWSYGLLDAEERQLLRRLAVFAGGADLDAVAAVCVDDGGEDAAEVVGRLVDASLVRAVGEPRRYLLLETVREYARSKLDDESILRRHAEHYLRVAEHTNLALDALGHGPPRPEIALREQHNFRAALDWAAAEDVELGLRLALSLENFWITQALAEGARRFEQLLERAGDGVDLLLRARATRDLAGCLDVLGEVERAKAGYARSGELFREAGDESGVATALFRLGIVAAVHEDDAAAARELYERALAIFRRVGDTVGELQALGSIGVLERTTGDPARGIELVERSIAMARDLGWVWWQARHTAGLATWYLGDGRPDEAERLGREFLSLAERTGSRQEVLLALAILARAAALHGDDARAVALWSSVEAVEDGPGRFGKFDRLEYAAAMPDVPRPAPLPLEEAVALARA